MTASQSTAGLASLTRWPIASSVRAVRSTASATSRSTATPDHARVVHATRIGRGARQFVGVPAGWGGAVYLSPTAGPWMASSSRAASRTLRVSPNS